MSDFAVAVVVVGVVLIAVWLAVRAYNARLGAQAGTRRWRLEERSSDGVVSIYAERAGDEPLLVGSVAWDSQEFEYRIEELRAEGQVKLTALNGGGAVTPTRARRR